MMMSHSTKDRSAKKDAYMNKSFLVYLQKKSDLTPIHSHIFGHKFEDSVANSRI